MTLNFARAANSLGFCAPLRWEHDKETTHEISLNPAYLRSRPARDVLLRCGECDEPMGSEEGDEAGESAQQRAA